MLIETCAGTTAALLRRAAARVANARFFEWDMFLLSRFYEHRTHPGVVCHQHSSYPEVTFLAGPLVAAIPVVMPTVLSVTMAVGARLACEKRGYRHTVVGH